MSDIGDYSIGSMLSAVPAAGSDYLKANPGLIKGLALAGRMASIAGQGRMSNQPDNRAALMSDAVAQYAAGGNIPKQPALQSVPVAPQNTSAAPVTNPADTNKDGVVSPQEQKVQLTMSGQGSHDLIRKLMDGYSSKGITATGMGGSDLPYLVANPDFQNSIGEQTGTPNAVAPVPVPQPAPFVQNLNTAGVVPNDYAQEQQRFQELAGLVGFENALKVAQQDVATSGANTNAIEARIKAEKMPAEIRNLNAIAMHSVAQADDLTAKLFQLYGYSPAAQGKVEFAKEQGKKQAEQGSIVAFAQTDLGKMPLPAELMKLQPGAKTYGDVAVMSGSMDGVHKLMELYNSRVVANINKAGTIGAADKLAMQQQLTSLGQIETSLGQEQRSLITDITKREDPRYISMLGTDDEKALNLATVTAAKSRLAGVNALIDSTRKTTMALGKVGEQPVAPVTSGSTIRPTVINGYKVPANSDWRITADGKVEYKSRGK